MRWLAWATRITRQTKKKVACPREEEIEDRILWFLFQTGTQKYAKQWFVFDNEPASGVSYYIKTGGLGFPRNIKLFTLSLRLLLLVFLCDLVCFWGGLCAREICFLIRHRRFPSEKTFAFSYASPQTASQRAARPRVYAFTRPAAESIPDALTRSSAHRP